MSIDPKYLARFSVVLNEAQSVPVAVAYATEDDTALQDVDYEHTAGELVFQPGETELYVNVPTRDFDASATSFKLQLTSPVNATVVRATGVALFPTGAGRQIVFRDTFDTPSESFESHVPEIGKGYSQGSEARLSEGTVRAFHPEGYSAYLSLTGEFRGASREGGSISLKFKLSDYLSSPRALLGRAWINLREAMHSHYFNISFYPASKTVVFEPSRNDFDNRTVFLSAVDGSPIDIEMRWNFADGVVGLYLNSVWTHSYQYAAPLDCFESFSIGAGSDVVVDDVVVSLSDDVAPPDVWEPANDPLTWYAISGWGGNWYDHDQYSYNSTANTPNTKLAARIAGNPSGAISWVGVWDGAKPWIRGPVVTWPQAPDAVEQVDTTPYAPFGAVVGSVNSNALDDGEYRLYAFVDGVQIPGYLWATWLPDEVGNQGYRNRALGYADGVGDEHASPPPETPLLWYSVGQPDSPYGRWFGPSGEDVYLGGYSLTTARVRTVPAGPVTWQSTWVPDNPALPAEPTVTWPAAPAYFDDVDNAANLPLSVSVDTTGMFEDQENMEAGKLTLQMLVSGVLQPGHLWMSWGSEDDGYGGLSPTRSWGYTPE